MDEKTARGLSGMFEAYRECGAASREASRNAVPLTLGAVLAAAAVAVEGDSVVCAVVAAMLLVLMVLYAKAVGRRTVARARLDAILSKKLMEAGRGHEQAIIDNKGQ